MPLFAMRNIRYVVLQCEKRCVLTFLSNQLILATKSAGSERQVKGNKIHLRTFIVIDIETSTCTSIDTWMYSGLK